MEIKKSFTLKAKNQAKDSKEEMIFMLTEKEKNSFSMRGDTKIVVSHMGKLGLQTFDMFRIMFNTSFIQNGNYIVAGKMELSPEDIRKDKEKLAKDFRVYIFFEDFCTDCNSYKTELNNLCRRCRDELGP